jgi:putative mRNA 3-end processing factor
MDVVTVAESGLHCAGGNFNIDPWRPVACAVLTHAHGDHARVASGRYLAARTGCGSTAATPRLGVSLIEREARAIDDVLRVSDHNVDTQ